MRGVGLSPSGVGDCRPPPGLNRLDFQDRGNGGDELGDRRIVGRCPRGSRRRSWGSRVHAISSQLSRTLASGAKGPRHNHSGGQHLEAWCKRPRDSY